MLLALSPLTHLAVSGLPTLPSVGYLCAASLCHPSPTLLSVGYLCAANLCHPLPIYPLVYTCVLLPLVTTSPTFPTRMYLGLLPSSFVNP